MSELKTYHRYSPSLIGLADYYLKSEADNVIAELEESHKMEVEQLLIEIAELKEHVKGLILDNYLKDKEIRHHKFKRCLAMAKMCVDLCHKAKDLYRWAEDENLEHHYNHKIEFFARWHKRWLKLADNYKEGNV